MRKLWLLLLLAPSALVYACGGDNTGTDGGTDATPDNTVKDSGGGDTAADTGTDTGTDTGPGDAGGDVAISITCLEPANCVDGGQLDASYPPDSGVVCCGTITGNGSTSSCQITSAATTCKAPSACATDFSGLLSCSSATVRFCNSTAECIETSGNPTKDGSKCCTASSDAGTFKVCANSTIAAASGGKIVCN